MRRRQRPAWMISGNVWFGGTLIVKVPSYAVVAIDQGVPEITLEHVSHAAPLGSPETLAVGTYTATPGSGFTPRGSRIVPRSCVWHVSHSAQSPPEPSV